MKSRKTRLFILAVILMMAFAGCREYATPISNSKNIETTVQAKDHGADIESFFISWNGTVQKFDRSAGTITGILSDIASLAWIAPPRGGDGFNTTPTEIKESDSPYILESSLALTAEDSAGPAEYQNIWVRIIRSKTVKAEPGTTMPGGKDLFIYKQNKTAFLAIQSEDLETWTVWELPKYGEWLDKEIQIFMRMATGL